MILSTWVRLRIHVVFLILHLFHRELINTHTRAGSGGARERRQQAAQRGAAGVVAALPAGPSAHAGQAAVELSATARRHHGWRGCFLAELFRWVSFLFTWGGQQTDMEHLNQPVNVTTKKTTTFWQDHSRKLTIKICFQSNNNPSFCTRSRNGS